MFMNSRIVTLPYSNGKQITLLICFKQFISFIMFTKIYLPQYSFFLLFLRLSIGQKKESSLLHIGVIAKNYAFILLLILNRKICAFKSQKECLNLIISKRFVK